MPHLRREFNCQQNIDRRRMLGRLSAGSLAAAASVSGWTARGWGQQATADPAELAAAVVAHGSSGVVASVHPLASQAAVSAFERGGNAMDAAVAASLMLSVVDGHNSGIGGGCLAIIRQADGSLLALDGRETAPGRAAPDMFYRNGKPDPQLSQVGPLAAGVPGLLAVLHRLAESHGRLAWQESLLQAAAVAEDGFALSQNYANVLAGAAPQLRRFPSSAEILLDGRGQAWPAGHVLRQTDLAGTLRAIAEQGVEWFYEGEFADRVDATMRQLNGLLSAADFAAYRSLVRQPIETTYRGRKVIGFPPPSSGGIHTAQMLGMLSGFDLAQIFEDSQASGLHLLLEVMKRAMADRAYWLGDADFAKVPRGLLDADYLRERAQSIDLSRSTEVASHGIPPRADVDLFGQQHTTHLTTADREGNVVAMTQTVNTSFGCKLIVPGTGVALNNELDDFSIAPGVRNAFGLLGSEANLIAPGKRPLSSMSPTVVLNAERRPILTCGAAGGPKIITAVLQVLVDVLDLGYSIEDALSLPRVHHQWSPDQAVCEAALDDQIVAQLQRLGHQTTRIASAAVAQGIAIRDSQLTAASDPRVPSSAMAL